MLGYKFEEEKRTMEKKLKRIFLTLPATLGKNMNFKSALGG